MERAATVRCEEARFALLDVLIGRTPPDVRRVVDAHLAICGECRQEAADLEETIGLLRHVPAPAVPEGFWADFMIRLEQQIGREPVRIGTRLRRWLATPPRILGPVAATAAVAVILGASSLLRQPETLRPSLHAQVAPFLTESMKTFLPRLSETVQLWQSGLGALDAEPLFEPPHDSP